MKKCCSTLNTQGGLPPRLRGTDVPLARRVLAYLNELRVWGSDRRTRTISPKNAKFQSTLHARGATGDAVRKVYVNARLDQLC